MDIVLFIKILVLFLIVDGLWLKLFMGPSYHKMIPKIQNSPMKTKLWTAICAYLLLGIGIYYLVIPHIKKESRYRDSIFYGGIFGLVVYGVYDFTAGSVLDQWDMKLAILDILWGMFVCAIVPVILLYLDDKIIKK